VIGFKLVLNGNRHSKVGEVAIGIPRWTWRIARFNARIHRVITTCLYVGYSRHSGFDPGINGTNVTNCLTMPRGSTNEDVADMTCFVLFCTA